jgi:hypothetical protein
MAVTQISRIQHRRGLQENLPQLASAELGWSIDQRRLFIGNGTTAEGAPIPGNTEILTQYTDIASVLSTYTFKGDESGYTSQTGPTSALSITRTLQHKLDEQISVRDFGAKGDGYTDDTVAIQRALSEVFPVGFYVSSGVRRVLHFPAGVYLISDTLRVPPYATIRGDGPQSSTIKQMGGFALLTFADSKGQIGVDFGTNSAYPPSDVLVADVGLETTTAYDVILADSITGLNLSRVSLKGTNTSPTVAGSAEAGIRITDSLQTPAHIAVTECSFSQLPYGVAAMAGSDILVTESELATLYSGITLTGPVTGVRVALTTFDQIAASAIVASTDAVVVSVANFFADVGTVLQGEPNAVHPVLYFGGPVSHSLADVFDRAFDSSVPAVYTGASSQTLTTMTASGSLRSGVGMASILADGSTASVAVLPEGALSGIIDYTISRGSSSRMGTLRFAGVNFEDDYTESGVNTGIQFSLASTGTAIEWSYSASVLGQNALIKYQLRNFG